MRYLIPILMFISLIQSNRGVMTREAKKAAKLEKKLKVLLGGYQSRAQGLTKQLAEVQEEGEQAYVELCTFQELQMNEEIAVPRRMEVSKLGLIWAPSYKEL